MVKPTRATKDSTYVLKHISIMEIMDWYPDRVVEVIDRKKDTVLVLNNMRIVFNK